MTKVNLSKVLTKLGMVEKTSKSYATKAINVAQVEAVNGMVDFDFVVATLEGITQKKGSKFIEVAKTLLAEITAEGYEIPEEFTGENVAKEKVNPFEAGKVLTAVKAILENETTNDEKIEAINALFA